MSKYEIEIDGLPDGYEPVKAVYVGDIDGNEDAVSLVVGIRRKMRKYDWGKTLDDVLTLRIGWEETGMRCLHKQDAHYKVKLAEVWQPNIHGKCPVDPEACIVKIRLVCGEELEMLAKCVNWGDCTKQDRSVVAWQFIRLADGVEW